MKTLLSLLLLLTFSITANAFYCPTKGRFLNLDPIGEEAFVFFHRENILTKLKLEKIELFEISKEDLNSLSDEDKKIVQKWIEDEFRYHLTNEIQNTYLFVKNQTINAFDFLGLAWIGQRPLEGFKKSGFMTTGPLGRALNTNIAHSHIFFEDKKEPTNVGYGQKGLFYDESSNGYKKIFGGYDDCIMRAAVDSAPQSSSYCLIGRNCQTWVDGVIKKYYELKSKK